jgi:hypothetical protein
MKQDFWLLACVGMEVSTHGTRLRSERLPPPRKFCIGSPDSNCGSYLEPAGERCPGRGGRLCFRIVAGYSLF